MKRKIFGNKLPARSLRSAQRTFRRYARRFTFSPEDVPLLDAVPMGPAYELFGVRKLEACSPGGGPREKIDEEKGIVLGTIRMGFGHYRIGLALASAARSMGLTPYWMDLMSFPDSAASRTIDYLEELYNLGSRVSQRFKWFDKLIWDRITSDMAKRLSYTARDRALSRIFAPLLGGYPKTSRFCPLTPGRVMRRFGRE